MTDTILLGCNCFRCIYFRRGFYDAAKGTCSRPKMFIDILGICGMLQSDNQEAAKGDDEK
jgi:hypothetical protein